MPPDGFFSRKEAIGEPSPSGSSNSILRVAGIDEDDSHAMFRQRLRRAHLCAERIAVDGARRLEIGHRDGDMVQASKHIALRRVGKSAAVGEEC